MQPLLIKHNFIIKNAMKRLLFVFIFLGSLQLCLAQSQIEMLIEGRKFVNNQTGLIFRYGYISSLNTYGVTISNANSNGMNYINCSKNVASDESYMILTDCFDPNTGSGGFSRAVVGSRRAILSFSDGDLEFVISDNGNKGSYIESGSPNSSLTNNVVGKPKKIGTLEIAQYDFGTALGRQEAIDASQKLGNGWRMPTEVELKLLYKNKGVLGGFNPKVAYWAIDKENNFYSCNFWDGECREFNAWLDGTGAKNNVRVVRIK